MKKLILVAISLLVAHYLHLAVASAGWVTSRRKQFTLGFAAACLSLSVITAHAWDGSATGSIVAIGGVASAGGAPGNLDVRVYLGNQPNMCTGAVDPTWAYINSNDANYKGITAMLLMAYSTGKTVTIYSNKGPSGYCQIGYLAM